MIHHIANAPGPHPSAGEYYSPPLGGDMYTTELPSDGNPPDVFCLLLLFNQTCLDKGDASSAVTGWVGWNRLCGSAGNATSKMD